MAATRTVFVIDDDADLRESVCALVHSMGYPATAFGSGEEFLAQLRPEDRGVVVVDLRLPGMNGLDVQEELLRRRSHLPVIILTAYARTPTTVRAIRSGAVTMIDKPYHDDDLWDAIRTAWGLEEVAWFAEVHRRELQERVATLTPDERQVAELVVAGKPNKSIANELGVALRTVEKRRHDVFTKMGASSVAELVEQFLRSRG